MMKENSTPMLIFPPVAWDRPLRDCADVLNKRGGDILPQSHPVDNFDIEIAFRVEH